MEVVKHLANLAQTMQVLEASAEKHGPRLPHFPVSSLPHVAKVLRLFPRTSLRELVQRVYPLANPALPAPSSDRDLQDTVLRVLDEFGSNGCFDRLRRGGEEEEHGNNSDARGAPTAACLYPLAGLRPAAEPGTAVAVFKGSSDGTHVVEAPVRTGDMGVANASSSSSFHYEGFVNTTCHADVLTGLLQDHAAGRDACIIGEKGVGKSAVARVFAHMLGYDCELFSLFKDMTARDLFQRRSTDAQGNTRWEGELLLLCFHFLG